MNHACINLSPSRGMRSIKVLYNFNDIRKFTISLANSLRTIGLMNVQYAVKDDEIYILEANPRASRTIPFLAKAIGIPFIRIAASLIAGNSLNKELLKIDTNVLPYYAIKEAVFPFNKFPNTDVILGPEMKSTGEVMGIDKDFDMAFLKSQLAAGQRIYLFLSKTMTKRPSLQL